MSYCTLEAAPDVIEALQAALPEAAPRRPWEPDLALLTGIPCIPRDDMPPGTWKLTEHDACKVDAESRTVTHEECKVTEGNK